jgi:hypothetical protein
MAVLLAAKPVADDAITCAATPAGVADLSRLVVFESAAMATIPAVPSVEAVAAVVVGIVMPPTASSTYPFVAASLLATRSDVGKSLRN